MHNDTSVRFRGRPRRVLALAGTSVVLLLSSALAARPGPALPDEIPASERSQLIEVTENASLATHAAGEPFVARPEVFVYLLDHPEFATHVTRTLRIARYRVWREPDGLWLDDGWGVVGRFSIVYAGNGTRVMYARGRYKQWFLPAIHGRAVVVIEYGAEPAANGKSVINAAVTGFVKLDNPLVEMIGKLLSAAAAAKAEKEAHQLVKVFARTTRAIDNDPAGVHELLRQRPDVPRRALEGVPESEVRVGLVDVETDRLAAYRFGFSVPPLGQQRCTQSRLRPHRVRLDPDRGPIRGRGVCPALSLAEHLAEVAVGPDVIGLDPNRLAKSDLGLGMAALPVERHAEAPAQGGMLGPEPERLAVRRLRLGVSALAAEAEREVGPHLERVRPEPHRLAQRGLGLGVLALAAERHAELVVQILVVGAERQRAPERGRRTRVVAEGTERQPPPRVQVRVVRLDCERLRVHRRLLRPAALPP